MAGMQEGPLDVAVQEAKALTSVVRLRILRLCLDEAMTNRELARRLDLNPATCLHHVRRLTAHGFLEALEPRRGARGAKEIPYRATGKSWNTPLLPGQERVLVQTFLDEFALADPQRATLVRMGTRLTPAEREAMVAELSEVIQRYADRGAESEGEPWSLFLAVHPDPQRTEGPRPD